MEKRLGEFIERVKKDFNLRCCGIKHEDWHFYLNLNECIEFYKSGFVSSKRLVKSEIASSEFIIYVLIEAIASVKFFKGIESSDNDSFYQYLINNGYEDLSYESFIEDLDQWLYTEDYQMFINGYCLSKYVKENIVSGELKMFAQFVKNDIFYSRVVDYFSGEFVSSRGLRAYNNEYLSMNNVPISDFTQKVLSYGYEKSRQPSKNYLKESVGCKSKDLDCALSENDKKNIETYTNDVDFIDEVSCEVGENNKYIDLEDENLDEGKMSLVDLDSQVDMNRMIEDSFIDESFVDELIIEGYDLEESFVEESFIEESFVEESFINEEQFKYEIVENNKASKMEISEMEVSEVEEECSNEDNIIIEKYTTTILDDSDEIFLFKVRFTEEEMDLAESIINRSLKLFQIDLIESCGKLKSFTETSQYILAANIVLGKILLLKDSPFDAIKMNMYEAEAIKYILSKGKIKEHNDSVRDSYLKVENLFKYQTEIESNKREDYYKFIGGKSNSAIMKIMFENK